MHLELNLEAIKSIVIVSTVRMTHKTNKIKKTKSNKSINSIDENQWNARASQVRAHSFVRHREMGFYLISKYIHCCRSVSGNCFLI